MMKLKTRKGLLGALLALLIAIITLFACQVSGAFAKAEKAENNQYFYATNPDIAISYGVPVPENGEGKPYYAQGYSGVRVDFPKEGGTVYFDKEIDVRALTENRTLLELMPLTTVAGTRNFDRVEVVLTDVSDPTIKFTYRFQYNPYYRANLQKNGNSGYAKAGGQNQELVGFELNGNVPFYGENLNGCPVYMSFEGTGQKVVHGEDADGNPLIFDGRAHKPLKIFFDYENQIAYANEGVRKTKSVIADLKASYATAEWTGFKSNKVRMSITVSKVNASDASIMLFNVMDNDFSKATVEDNVKPEVYVDTLGYEKLPEGLVYEKYPVFQGSLVDNFDGDIAFEPYVLYEGKENVAINDGYFYPDKVGKYSIYYGGKDSSGLVADTKVLSVNIAAKLPAISYQTESPVPTSGEIGSKIILPDGNATGGSGRLTLERTVQYPSGEVKAVGKSFVPESMGQYKYSVKITDFLNRQKTFVYWIEVQTKNSPVIKVQSMPEKLINGATYYMSSQGFEAWDYYSYGVKTEAVKTVTLKDSTGNIVETHHGEGFYFVADKEIFGESLTMTWEAKAVLYPYTSSETKTCSIIDVKNSEGIDIDKYFHTENVDQVVDNYKEDTSEEGLEVFNELFLSKSEMEVQYLLPVPESSIEISFEVPKNYNNFKKLTVRLRDSWDPSIYVDMEITQNPESKTKSFFYFGGEKTYEFNGSYCDDSTSQGFVLYVSDGFVKDKLGTSIGKLSHYADGSAFDGFPSGSVYVSLLVSEVGELETNEKVGVLVSKICRQFVLNVPQDGIVPQIVKSSHIDNEATKGQEVYIPFVRGFDVISGQTQVYLTVVNPSGETVCKNLILTEDGYKFTAYETGKYSVTFMTMDTSMNVKSEKMSISVYDTVAPIVWLDEPIATEYKLNHEFSVPNVSIQDNKTKDCTMMLLLITPKTKTIYLDQDEKYTLSVAGTYSLIVFVEDEDYNITSFTVKFSVK